MYAPNVLCANALFQLANSFQAAKKEQNFYLRTFILLVESLIFGLDSEVALH
jgi:hypothetical protein